MDWDYTPPLHYYIGVAIASNPGAEEGGKSAWYPLFAHALTLCNYCIKPRGFMQMMSQNFPSVNNDVYIYTTQRNHEDMIAALTLTFGTWSVISAMRDETTMTTLSSRASFTSNTNGITQWLTCVDRVSSYTHFKDALCSGSSIIAAHPSRWRYETVLSRSWIKSPLLTKYDHDTVTNTYLISTCHGNDAVLSGIPWMSGN